MTTKANPVSHENRNWIATNLRADRRMVDYELIPVVEFQQHTAKYFTKQIKVRKAKAAAHPASYWDEDAGGATRGELEADEIHLLEALAQLNNRFGILGVFGAFERFLLRIHQDMMYQNLIHKNFKKRYLTFDGYKDSLKKIGIRLTEDPFDWENLRKLHTFRNAIAHQDGWVTDENIKYLRNYGYKKVGQPIEITEKYFQESLDLVTKSCDELVKQYNAVRGTKTHRSRRKSVPLLAALSLFTVFIVGRAALRNF